MWIILALGASLFWGLTYVFNQEVYKKISIFSSLALISLVTFIVTFVAAYFSGVIKTDIDAILSSRRLLGYVLASIGAFLIAELLIAYSISAKNATLAGLIEISYPIFIALFSYILFKNNVSLPTILGGVLIFIGVFVIYYFNR